MAESEQTVTILAVLKDEITQHFKPITEGFGELKASIKEIGEVLEPIWGQTEKFIAGFSAFEAIHKALEVAQEAADANAKLNVSFEGNQERIEAVNKVAEQYSKTTEYSVFQLKALAAQLHNAGVAASEVPKYLQLTVDATARYGGSIEATGNQISLLYQGIIPRSIGTSRAAIRVLAAENDKDTDRILAALQERVANAAADIAAQDPFRQEKILVHEASDAYANLGLIFEKLKTTILAGVAPAAKSLLATLDSPAGQTLVRWVGEAVKLFVELLPTIIKVYVAYQAYTFATYALEVATTALLFVLSPLGIAMLAVGFAVYGLLHLLKELGILDEFRERLGKIFDALLAGKITAKTAFSDIMLEAKAFLTQIDGRLLQPLKLSFQLCWDYINLSAQQLWKDIEYFGLQGAKFISTGFFQMVRDVAAAIDKVNGYAGQALTLASKIPGASALGSIAPLFKTNFAGQVPTSTAGTAGLSAAIAKVNDEAKQIGVTIDGLLPKFLDKLNVAEHESNKKAAALRAQEDLGGGPAGAAEDTPEAKAAKARQEAQEKHDTEVLQEEHNQIVLHKTQELLDAQNELDQANLEYQWKYRLISLQDYLTKKDALERDVDDRAVARLDKQIAAKQSLYDKGDDKGAGKGDKDLLAVINDLEEKRQNLLIKQGDQIVKQREAVIDLTRAEDDRNRKLTESLQERTLHASNTGTNVDYSAEEQATVLAEQAKQEQELIDAKRTGLSLDLQAKLIAVQKLELIKAQADAIDAMNKKEAAEIQRQVGDAKDRYETIVKGNELAVAAGTKYLWDTEKENDAALDAYIEKLKEAQRELQALANSVTDPKQHDALQKQADAMSLQLDTMIAKTHDMQAAIVKNVQGPLEGLFKGLIEHTKTAKQVLADFFKSIASNFADMAAKMAAQDLISAVLGTAGGAGGSNPINTLVSGLLGGGTLQGALVGAESIVAPTLSGLGSIGGGLLSGLAGLFNEGGVVGGGSYGPNADTMLIAATPGEMVIQRPAVEHYGSDVLHAVNDMLFPRASLAGVRATPRHASGYGFNAGGEVRNTTQQQAAGSHALVVANDQSMERLLAGGSSAMLKFMRGNRDQINSALGQGAGQ